MDQLNSWINQIEALTHLQLSLKDISQTARIPDLHQKKHPKALILHPKPQNFAPKVQQPGPYAMQCSVHLDGEVLEADAAPDAALGGRIVIVYWVCLLMSSGDGGVFVSVL